MKLRMLTLFFWLTALTSIGTAAAPAVDAPRRIISLSPNITETLFLIGAGDQVVGVTEFCKWPPEAADLPHCGGWANPNFEVITALEPDLVLIQGEHESVRRFCEARGLRFESVYMESVASILEETRRIGQWAGHADAATSLSQRIEANIASVHDRLPEDHEPPRVFISIARDPGSLGGIHTASRNSFLTQAIELAGGRNVFDDTEQFYPQASKETLLVRRPEVILELAAMGIEPDSAEARQLIADWQALPSLPAVRNERIRVLTEDYLLIPGPRVDLIVERFHEALQASD